MIPVAVEDIPETTVIDDYGYSQGDDEEWVDIPE